MSHRVLIVEDNLANLELLYVWLEGEGYLVDTATTLDGAFVTVQRHPDAVLLDIQLGRHDGLSLVAWMREQADLASIPVIAVTAHALAPERQRARQAGCADVLSKPVDFNVLRKCLEHWLPSPVTY